MTDFNDFNLSESLLKAIAAMGFVEPSEIQAQAIPTLLEGMDIIGQAQTGTGKTAAFAIPAIERIDMANRASQVLILCPTRELVVQVAGELEKLTKYESDLSVLAVYGGQDISVQLRALKKGAQIIVGTPGRIMDHMKRKSLKLDQLSYVVLDEADQMLDMGFEEDMEVILSKAPKDRQTVMFSATMSKSLMALMKEYQNNPEHINTAGEGKQSKQINQLYFDINKASKDEALKRLISYHKIGSALIFCNTKIKVDQLAKELDKKRYSAAALHGDMDQRKRDRVMRDFRKGNIELLIATDVAARGLDVDDLEAVINYDLPRFDQDYVHRIGRTGRAGKVGLALTFVVGKEIEHLKRIAKKNNMVIENAKVPQAKDFQNLGVESVKALIQHSGFKRKDFKKYFGLLDELELYEYSHEELAAVLLKTLLDQEANLFSKDVNFEPEKIKTKSSSKSRSDRSQRHRRERSSAGKKRFNSERKGKGFSQNKSRSRNKKKSYK